MHKSHNSSSPFQHAWGDDWEDQGTEADPLGENNTREKGKNSTSSRTAPDAGPAYVICNMVIEHYPTEKPRK
jgi:hypothetical protein